MNKEQEVSLRWEKDQKYYISEVTKDLFGWVFVRTWGRKATRLGRSMRTRVDSFEHGLKAMEQVKKRRLYRGYELVEAEESHTCNLCSREFVKPAVQFRIDGSEDKVCPVCCERLCQ
jgi:rubrerythrin